MEVSRDALERIREFYEQGLLLRAWREAEQIGPLDKWAGPDAAIMAGRLAANLGGRRLGNAIHWRNQRQHPTHARAAAYHLHGLKESRGPLKVLEWLEAHRALIQTADPDTLVYFLTIEADVMSDFRDFDAAWRLLKDARQVAADGRWIDINEASLLEGEDRYDEALTLARRSLAGNASYRPGVLAVAHTLRILDRNDEALAFLREADARMECNYVALQLASLEIDLGLIPEALSHFDRFLELSPLADKGTHEWLNHQRVAAACRTGNLARARELARTLKGAYYEDLAARLELPDPPRRRVQLPVAFVRQHHLTCVPATLAALSRFWNQPVAHLELADQICYDGTSAYSERHWAEANGYAVREFAVTWESAVALIETGIPFTLSTTEATSGHAQAVIGFDELRRTLLLRDPFNYAVTEALCPRFLERYAAHGPRGLAMVPEALKERLFSLELPDAALYDHLFHLNAALRAHRREEAAGILSAMEQEAPEHRMVLTAGRALAAYDANGQAMRKVVDALAAKFPDDGNLVLAKWNCLAEQETRASRIQFLDEALARPLIDPVLHAHLASELRADARVRSLATGQIRRALRYRPVDPHFLAVWADILWDEQDTSRATRIYRLAACAGATREIYAQKYFSAGRSCRQTDAALTLLRSRFERLGRKSGDPATTLFDSLITLDRVEEAFGVLDEALALRPDDGELLLFAAEAHCRFGRAPEAQSLLKRAEGRSRRASWLRASARLAGMQADRRQALRNWQEVLQLEPLAMDANRAAAGLLAETEGQTAAQQFLADCCARFPSHCGLLELRVTFLREAGPAAMEPALRCLIAANPASDWAHRELAIQLEDLNRSEEAMASAEEAIQIDPAHPVSYGLRGDLHLRHGRREKARSDFRRALELAIDSTHAMYRLIDACDDLEQSRDAVQFIEREMIRQVVFGPSLAAFGHVARKILDPEAVLARLNEAKTARPDLWFAWAEVARHLAHVNRLDEALSVIAEACERFPFVPQLWVDRARILHTQLNDGDAIAAIERGLAMSPEFGEASRFLASLLESSGQVEKALRAVELACANAPLDFESHGAAAFILWKLGRKEDALARIQHAIRLEPGYEWAWSNLREWAGELERADLPVQLARDLTQRRGGEARSWRLLAECLIERDDADAISAADEAIARAPRDFWNHDTKAVALARQNRFDEALACCTPAGIAPVPPELLHRSAWVEAQRGRIQEAIKMLGALLDRHPSDYAAWQYLADLQVKAGNLKAAAAAADEMARLAPHNPVPLGYAASLLLQEDEPIKARDRLRRAFALDARYTYAGFTLLDNLIDFEILDEADEVMARLRPHAAADQMALREINLHLARRQTPMALERFERLCREPAPGAEGWSLFRSAESLEQASLGRASFAAIERALEEPSPHPCLGALWVSRRLARGKYRLSRTMNERFTQGEMGRLALAQYLDGIAEHWNDPPHRSDLLARWNLRRYLRKVLQRHRDFLYGDDFLWGKTGYALAVTDQFDEVIRWLSDWPHRAKVEAWMLYNLVLALLVSRRPEEARTVIEHGLTMRQDPALYTSFAVLAAMEEALRDNRSRAKSLHDGINTEALSRIDRGIHELTAMLLEATDEAGGVARERVRRIRLRLKSGLGGVSIFQHEKIVKISYWRCMAFLVRQPGMQSFRWWGWMNYHL